MSLPVTVPNTFANSTVAIPLSNLDNNFTTITNSINGLTNGSSQINVASISATGTANSTTFLRGDGSWANVATGGGGSNGTVTSVNAATANGFSFSGGPITTSGTLTLTVPSPGTSGNILTSNGTAWISSAGAYPLTTSTVNAGGVNPFALANSVTSITFSSIPSWVKRISVLFSNVSTNGTAVVLVQIGSGSTTSSGYISAAQSAGAGQTSTSGFAVTSSLSASNTLGGQLLISNVYGNNWCASGSMLQISTGATASCGGFVTLSGTLDRVVITTSGTDIFDSGSINILYE